jgi:hypothetical protein
VVCVRASARDVERRSGGDSFRNLNTEETTVLRQIFGSRRPVRHESRSFRPGVEVLETRSVPSAGGVTGQPIVGPEPAAKSSPGPIIPNLPSTPTFTANTVPANGDVNPYGVAFVPKGFATGGPLNPGDILVSNFNNSGNLQGTGSTIVRVTPTGQTTLFYQGPQGLGLTTGLGVLKAGFVVVGNMPTTDGTSDTVQAGSLMILDKNGFVVANLANAAEINGPWDLTVHDMGNKAQVFVSNVLNGTIVRIDLKLNGHHDTATVQAVTEIASGYGFHSDPAALEVGPTGLSYNPKTDTLLVASTADNEIFSVPQAGKRTTNAGRGTVVVNDPAHLHGPLGLAVAPNGDILVSSGDAVNPDPNQTNEIAEYSSSGQFVAQFQVDPNGSGGAFGLAIQSQGNQVTFAAVDDVTNTLDIWDITM